MKTPVMHKPLEIEDTVDWGEIQIGRASCRERV